MPAKSVALESVLKLLLDMNTLTKRLFGGREGLIGNLILAIILVAVLPLTLDIFRLNLVGGVILSQFEKDTFQVSLLGLGLGV